ncbi:MAG: N-substituted formamide deformylase [Bryobacteraceae bacterium]|nr:N-substituted formamide deformylase [Bryobacteraceae bacterium]
MTCGRRGFLTLLGAAPFSNAETVAPELILYNGVIHTIDASNPRVEAVAIARGRFLATGTNHEMLALASARARKVDLGGKTVVPGFIDAHTHVASSGLRHLRQVDCDLRSIAAIQAAIRRRASGTPPGEWVIGFKYDDTKTDEGRKLTRADLDSASPAHPVFIEHRGGHTAYVNSLALRIAGIDDRTPDPAGGQFDRDRSGHLTGGLRENATRPFLQKLPNQYSRGDRREAVKLMTRMFARAGVTSVHDAQGSPEDLFAYQDARAAGDLRVRVYHLLNYRYLDRMLEAGIRTGMGDEWIRVGAMKLVSDGSISERTAHLSRPYAGRPNDFGIQVMPEEELYHYARKAHEAGWQIGIHANGDAGIDIALRVYERLQKEMPRRDARYRLEHCTLVNDSLIRRIKALGAIPTPFSTYVYYHGEKMSEYGEERLNRMFALRSFLDAGIRPTQASDYPPGPFEPMMALQSEVTRTGAKGHLWGPRQKVTVDEALRIGTLHGAYASFEEGLKGSITPGKLADLVVLGRDPRTEPPSTLVTIPVERTMAGGAWVYES